MNLQTPSQGAPEVFNAWGFDQNRDYFSELPFEHIDPMTGNLLLTFTDLVLPGNAGFETCASNAPTTVRYSASTQARSLMKTPGPG
jgi:hypothetical protein